MFDPDGETPNFSYSIGFTKTLGQPEFIVFGLDLELMHEMLWIVFKEMKAGKIPKDGDRWPGILEGHECEIRRVHPSKIKEDYFNSAMWFWGDPAERGESLSAFQIIWPGSKDRLFPWDKGSDSRARKLQPALYEPPYH